MKKSNVFTTIIFFIFIIVLILITSLIILNSKKFKKFNLTNYKSEKNGNNIISSKEIAMEYILNIKEYEADLEITVKSNKNENVYNIKQVSKENYSYQESKDKNMPKIIVENNDGMITVRNDSLNIKKIYESYGVILENTLYLTSFVEELKKENDNEIIEDNNYYIINLKIKNYKNKYIVYKSLYINKNTSKIEKLEIQDINKNRTIYILYKSIEIKN